MAVSRTADKKFLEKHGNKWRVVIPVPQKARAVIGKTKLRHPLGTDSLTTANRLKWPVVQMLQGQIDRALSPHDHQATALYLAKMRKDAANANDGDTEPEDLVIDAHVEEILGDPIGVDRHQRPVYEPQREATADAFADIARGRRTPLDSSRERYLAQLAVNHKTKADDERAFGVLTEWCSREKVPFFRETFGQREAVRFFDDFANSEGRTERTRNKYLVRLSLYWKWMRLRGEVESNVWEGLSYTIPHETDETQERPFTEDEMKMLLAGPAVPHMHDLMRIAALTGARLNVIVSLTVGDCQDGTIRFKAAKKEKAARLIPIHPALAEVIARRTEGKALTDELFPEWPPVQKAGSKRERSYKVSMAFTTYRRKRGVADELDVKRRSLVNFHSFRRWFITEAERADQPESTIASVVGHKRGGMTFGVYSKGPKLEQARRCVEAVHLPDVPKIEVLPYLPKRKGGGRARSEYAPATAGGSSSGPR